MNKKITDEEIVKAAECCVENDCGNCPLSGTCCRRFFAEYIINTTKPAFDWDGFISGKFKVRLKTQTDYDAFMRECEQHELNWGPENLRRLMLGHVIVTVHQYIAGQGGKTIT